ncbi:terminase DNA packaging enzyme small subunit [Aeromonas phage AP1]|nr:terminase DNA packaging enzyme small subunit [Aeromonas phage AP1]
MNIENATVFMGTPAELMLREGTQTQAQSLVIDGESEEVKNAN